MTGMTKKSLVSQSIDLGFAVPQVLAHRLSGMDSAEFYRMSTEKVVAFNEAWAAMAAQAFVEYQKLALSFWLPWNFRDAGLSILGKGMAPIRRRAVANAKRLGRSGRRN